MKTTKILSDKAAERAVLAGICRHGSDAYYDIADILQADTFTETFNSVLYGCLARIMENDDTRKIDLPSVHSAAHEMGVADLFTEKTEGGYLEAIMNFPVELRNVRAFAAKIRKLQVTRLLHSQLGDAQNKLMHVKGDEPVAQILGIAEDTIFDFTSLLNDNDNEPEVLGDGAEEFLQHLADNPVEQIGISTGFPRYDECIGGGLRRGTVNMIGARPKTGKTLLTDNMGYHIASTHGLPVLNLDTEMRKEDHLARSLAMLSGVGINDIETGRFGQKPESFQKAMEGAKKLKAAPYFHKSVAGMPFEEILALIRRWIVKEVGLDENGKANDCVIFYDYLKLMDSKGVSADLKEYQLLGFMMTGLHNFAVRYDVPILSLMQLNRDGIKDEGTGAASGSDRIIWLCSNFTIFKKKSPEELSDDPEENGTHKLCPVVTRHGGGIEDGNYINVQVKGWCAQILEGETRFELDEGAVRNNLTLREDGDDEDEGRIPFQ